MKERLCLCLFPEKTASSRQQKNGAEQPPEPGRENQNGENKRTDGDRCPRQQSTPFSATHDTTSSTFYGKGGISVFPYVI